jgi:TRAP-type C4-dicarboxylate transport system permease small subunit
MRLSMKRLVRIEHIMSHILDAAVTVFFFIILSLTIILVVLRYGFDSTIIGGNEAMEYLFIYTTALGAAVSVGREEHIKISFFKDKLKVRYRKAVTIFDIVLIGFINAVMVWYSLPWIRSAGYFESPVLRIPNWIVQISIPIGCILVMLYCLNHVVLELFNLKSSDPQR